MMINVMEGNVSWAFTRHAAGLRTLELFPIGPSRSQQGFGGKGTSQAELSQPKQAKSIQLR